VNGTGLGSYPVAGFRVRGVELSGSATKVSYCSFIYLFISFPNHFNFGTRLKEAGFSKDRYLPVEMIRICMCSCELSARLSCTRVDDHSIRSLSGLHNPDKDKESIIN
jgi:hypothetical protein